MKIIATYPFLTQKRGGELAFLNMTISLKRKGHEIHVLVLDISDEFMMKLQKEDIKVISLNFKEYKLRYIDPILNIINKIRMFFLYRKLASKINRTYDVAFVVHSPIILPYLRIPKVYYCYEPPRDYYEPLVGATLERKIGNKIYFLFYAIDKYIDAYCVKHADLILTPSDYSREYTWRSYGIFPITNYLGVDTKKFRPLNIEKKNIVVHVGALHPRKAHDFVINAIKLIPEAKRPKLVIVGAEVDKKKKMKDKLYALATNSNVSIEIKSNIPDEELVKLYNMAKVVAIAYIMEPSIEPEALACETPIVAVREGGARETIVNGETGILTNRDEKEFGDAIEYLLDHPDAAAEMGRKGREWIEKNFTWDMCAENLEKNFMKAIKNWRNKSNIKRIERGE